MIYEVKTLRQARREEWGGDKEQGRRAPKKVHEETCRKDHKRNWVTGD